MYKAHARTHEARCCGRYTLLRHPTGCARPETALLKEIHSTRLTFLYICSI